MRIFIMYLMLIISCLLVGCDEKDKRINELERQVDNLMERLLSSEKERLSKEQNNPVVITVVSVVGIIFVCYMIMNNSKHKDQSSSQNYQTNCQTQQQNYQNQQQNISQEQIIQVLAAKMMEQDKKILEQDRKIAMLSNKNKKMIGK